MRSGRRPDCRDLGGYRTDRLGADSGDAAIPSFTWPDSRRRIGTIRPSMDGGIFDDPFLIHVLSEGVYV